jgi:hypothetical protein
VRVYSVLRIGALKAWIAEEYDELKRVNELFPDALYEWMPHE